MLLLLSLLSLSLSLFLIIISLYVVCLVLHCLPTSRHPLTLLLSCIVVVVDYIIAFVVVVVVVIVFDNYIVVCCLFGLPTCNLFSSSSHATPFVSLVVVGINCLVVVAGLLLFVSLLF